jgi:tetratricopeptide (TPR) repeat protein
MLSVVLSWVQKTRELTDMINMFNEGRYQDVFEKISNRIQNDGIDNVPMNTILIHAKAGLMTGNSRTSINELTYLLKLPNTKYQRITLHLLRARAYLNIGSLNKAFNESKSVLGYDSIYSDIEEAATLFGLEKYTYNSINKLVCLCPESGKALLTAAKFYKQQGNMDKFEKYAILALKYDDSNKEARHELAKYYICNFRVSDAYSLYKNCSNSTKCGVFNISDTINLPQYCSKEDKVSLREKLMNSRELIKRGAYNKAYVVLSSMINSNPSYQEAYYQRAKIFVANNDIESAIDDLKRAHKIPKARSLLNTLQSKYVFRPYSILNLREGSSYKAVHKQYILLVKKWHPDRYHQPLDVAIAESKMRQLNKAIESIEREKNGFVNDGYPYNDVGFMRIFNLF